MRLLPLCAALWGCTYANIDHAFHLNSACTLNKSPPQRTPEAERNFISFVRYLVTDRSTGGESSKTATGRTSLRTRERRGEKKAARCKSQRRKPPPLALSDLHSGLEQVYGGTLIICSRPANASVFESFLCSLTKKVRTGNKSVSQRSGRVAEPFSSTRQRPGGNREDFHKWQVTSEETKEIFCVKQFSSVCFSSKFPFISFTKKHVFHQMNAKCEPSHWIPKTHKCL